MPAAYDLSDRDRARFWAKVKKTETCWLWTRPLGRGGYGYFWLQGSNVLAHRAAWLLLVGPIPEGLDLDHVRANGCTSRACVKAVADEHGPAHLEPVTERENSQRAAALITHCPQGHPYDEANTMVSGGRRNCRECKRANYRAWYTTEYARAAKAKQRATDPERARTYGREWYARHAERLAAKARERRRAAKGKKG